MMNEKNKEVLFKLWEEYKKSQSVKGGTPDQYQYRKNKLITLMCEFIFMEHIDILQEKEKADIDLK